MVYIHMYDRMHEHHMPNKNQSWSIRVLQLGDPKASFIFLT